jgi:hypothetical protein
VAIADDRRSGEGGWTGAAYPPWSERLVSMAGRGGLSEEDGEAVDDGESGFQIGDGVLGRVLGHRVIHQCVRMTLREMYIFG